MVCRREATEGHARTFSLDLLAQWQGFERNGQFRFTPPTHVLLAFAEALQTLDAEGGLAGRAARYAQNHATLIKGMQAIGFRPFLAPAVQAPIITAFAYPEHPAFDFGDFYQRLSDRGFVIYPGKVSHANLFRIGNIGQLYPQDMTDLLEAIGAVLVAMGVSLPIVAA